MKRAVAALIALAAVNGVSAQGLSDERRALERAQAARLAAAARATELERASVAAASDAQKLRADAAAIAARIQVAEADIDTAEARIAVVERLRAQQRARLAAKQTPTIRLVAALQTLARRPALLALVQPGSITDVVHVHAVLAGVMPVVRARTAELRADVDRGRALRAASDRALIERREAQTSLVAQRQRLALLEARKRTAAAGFASGAMVEQDRAMAMGEEARDIVDLMGRIDTAADVRARLETLPGPVLRPISPAAVRAPVLPAAVVLRIPAYRLPVVGQVVTGLGEVSETGVRARGLTIATRPGAQVVAPTTGRVAYAAPFRGYGRIVVIDHGLGWTTLITSLATLDVRVGDQVDRGSPIGRAGSDRPTITVELRRQGAPVDIARLAG